MEPTFVSQYLNTQKNLFFANFKIISKNADIDAIHDLRVSVKSIRALFRMLNFDTRLNFRLKNSLQPINAVYKTIGTIRDYQIIEALLVEYQQMLNLDLNEFIKDCVTQKWKAEQKFFEMFHLYSPLTIKRSFRIIEFYIAKSGISELKERIISYCENRDAKLLNYINPKNTGHDLHEARKMIKEIAYLMELSNNEIPSFSLNYLEYKENGRLLGNWHDRLILANYLKPFKTDVVAYKSLVEQVLSEKQFMSEKFYHDFANKVNLS